MWLEETMNEQQDQQAAIQIAYLGQKSVYHQMTLDGQRLALTLSEAKRDRETLEGLAEFGGEWRLSLAA